MKKVISTTEAPKAIGPYSQAIEANGTVYISGQLGIIPETGTLAQGIELQAEQSLKNIGAILKEAGLTYNNIVKCTVLLDNIDNFKTLNEIYGKFFTEQFPARAAYQVAKLPLGGLIEIEAIAVK
ncbi:MAG: reactive intermediate/imine deaminase [Bacteroidetes bacterium CG_4_10_14_3_um_filter_31_20]|nr:RidA family protein [Bacteroidota bacterium]PIY03516.1 MAG: reactive intermediate/imine deaminase [Bacteroidetes bacterium CG_4_10_14_3_um_filter_31_20]